MPLTSSQELLSRGIIADIRFQLLKLAVENETDIAG